MASIFQQILTLSCDFVPVFKFGRLWLWRWHPRSTSLLYFSHYWCVNCHCGQQFLQPRNKNAHSCGGRPQTETELCLSETVNAARPCAACAAPGSVHRKRPCCIPHHDFLLLICSRDALILNDRHVWWCSNSTQLICCWASFVSLTLDLVSLCCEWRPLWATGRHTVG